MESIGVVISLNGNMATVNVRRVSACGENCASCKGGCVATTIKTTAENLVSADVGDTVKIESNTTDVVRAAFFLYMMPVVVALIFAVITYAMKISDIFVILSSVAAFFVGFKVIKRFEKKLIPRAYINRILYKGVK